MTNLKITDKFKDSLYPILTFLAIIIVWQAVVEIKYIPQYILPTPIDIIKVFITDYQNLFDNTLVTLYETILGFILALLVALTLGIIMDFVSVIRKCLYPILVVSQTIPTITIAPLLIIWFGFEALPKILMVALTCFFPILISFVDGLENIDIIALIDARRIMRDIKYHIFEVPYFKEGDAIVEINEEDYSIYYGASEVLEGDRYKTMGIYRYN